jgi:hypothetical protein
MFTHCLDQVPCSFRGAKHYSNLAAVLLKISRTCNLEEKVSVISTTTSRTATTTSTVKPCPVCPVTVCTTVPPIECDNCDSCCDDCPVCDECEICQEVTVEECPGCPSTTPCPPAAACPTMTCPTVEPCPTVLPSEPVTPCPTIECPTTVSPPTTLPCQICEACPTEKTQECDRECPNALMTCKERVKELDISNSTCYNDSQLLIRDHDQMIENMKVSLSQDCEKRVEPLVERIQSLHIDNRYLLSKFYFLKFGKKFV